MRSSMRSLLITLAAAAAATTAYAQAPTGGGAGSASPEVRAARMEAHKACASDDNTYCSGKQGKERMQCMHENAAKLSAPCKAAIAKLPKAQGAMGAATP